MSFLVFLSGFIVPFVMVTIVIWGFLMKVDLFDAFVKGAMEGFEMVYHILPTLVGLMVAIGVLRGSGALDALGEILTPVGTIFHIPHQIMPLILVKLFSASAATSVLIDIFKQYGTDSRIGLLACLFMSCSETIFYTISFYFMSVKMKKTGWSIPLSFLATLAGFIVVTQIFR